MLVGRDHERERIRIVLANAVQGEPGALVIRGDPGMGKTKLLSAAAESANDLRIIRVDGHEAETDIPYAALSMLLGPLIHGLAGLPATQATALKAALDLGPAVHGDRLGVAAATLTLLANSADDQPLFIAVDDAHLLDLPSLEALVFSIRRMRAERIAVVLTARYAVDVAPAAERWLAALPEMALNGLDFTAAKQLVADRGVLSSAMWEATAGNPLALLDLPTTWSSTLPVEPVHLSRRLVRAYERRMAGLSENTRRAVLLIAVAGSADDAVDDALAQQGGSRRDLDAAEDAGLLVQDTSGLRFRHPLVRSAIYHAATAGRKRSAHQALAAVYERRRSPGAAERRAFHLAAATSSPDEDIASQLAAAARQAAARQSHVTALALFERAARLSPVGPARTQRLLDAALMSQAAGCAGGAVPLLELALAEADNQHLITTVQQLQCRVQMWCGQPIEARDDLLALADRTEITDPAWSARMRSQAALTSANLGDHRLAVETAGRAARLVQHLPPVARLPVVVIEALTLAIDGASTPARDLLAWCEEHLAEHDPLSIDQLLVVAANAYASVEDPASARRWLEFAVRTTRSAGGVGLLPFQLSWLASACWRDGDWAAGLAHAHAAVSLTEETGWLTELPHALIVLATFEATLGDAAGCREHAARAVELAAPSGARIFEAYAARTLGLLELGEGRPGPAAEHLSAIAEFADTHGLGNPVLLSWAGDLVEAHVRAGQPHGAQHAFDVLVREAERTGRPTEHAIAARCRGLLYADDEQGYDAFTEALQWHERARQPFEQARSQLCFGEFMRRRRRPTEARQVLGDALSTFTRLGARLWAQRTEAELRATGIASRPRREGSTTQLTPQEMQVALVVADGATNVEAAAQLFLSAKTIEFHLSNTYRKLGIRSRAQLVRVFANTSGALGGGEVRDGVSLTAR
ncbi:MAG TPA: AAA family ATPase [Pseudonocardiaceae bacterium]|nr:AAA family ATPase [Pseudonocardiaceae bacterium]